MISGKIKDILFDYISGKTDTSSLALRDIGEESSVKQVVMNTLKTRLGEISFPGYYGFGSDFTSLERENIVSDDELKEIITLALDEHIQNGLIDAVVSASIRFERGNTQVSVVLERGNETLNVLI